MTKVAAPRSASSQFPRGHRAISEQILVLPHAHMHTKFAIRNFRAISEQILVPPHAHMHTKFGCETFFLRRICYEMAFFIHSQREEIRQRYRCHNFPPLRCTTSSNTSVLPTHAHRLPVRGLSYHLSLTTLPALLQKLHEASN